MAGTDRFYTAPQGPDVSPDVEMPRNARYEISSSPDMFGGLIAKGLSEAGKGLTDAYNVYGQVAADQATNNFLGKLTDLRTEFENTRGQDTINAWRGVDGAPGYPQKAQAAFDEARSTVPGGFQNAFDNVGRRYLFASNSAGDSHFRTQSGEWAKVTATTMDQKAINSISSHPNDDATFNANVDSMAHAAVVQAQIAYGIHEGTTDPDAQMITKEAHDIAVGRAWYARIEAVRPTNSQQAVQWAKEHAEELGKLGPQVQNQMRGYLGQSQMTEWDKQASAATAGGHAVALGQQTPAGAADVYFHPDALQVYKARTAQIESGGNPNAVSSAGATGKYQFIPATWRRYGGGSDIHGDQEAAMDRLTMDNAKTMSYALGRAPQLWELYLGHQQGPMGAYHLLTEPNRRAGDIVGNAAIRGNGGDPNAPASAFTAMWHAKFGNMSGGPIYAGGGQPGNVTVQSATNPHVQFTGPPSDPFISGQTASATPGAQPVMSAAGPDQGGEEGQSVQPAAYQPMGLVGGGGGGAAPNIQQPGMETVPPQQSPFISPEERAYHEKDDELRRKMLWVINNDKIPEGGTPTAPGKEEMLRGYERDRDGLKIGYHQDAEYRKYVANQARAGIAQIIDKGDYLGAVKATNDALAQGRIDEQGWATMNSVIQRRSGDPDIGALGPGLANVMRGIAEGKITSPKGIDQMYVDGQIGWLGRQRALEDLKLRESVEEGEGFLIRRNAVLAAGKRAVNFEADYGSVKIPDPKGSIYESMFENAWFSAFDKWKKDGEKGEFPYMDPNKAVELARSMRPPEDMERDRLDAQNTVSEAPGTPPQRLPMPPGFTEAQHPAWTQVVGSPPFLLDGKRMTTDVWGTAVSRLVAKPRPRVVAAFERQYPGQSAEGILKILGVKMEADKAEGEHEKATPKPPDEPLETTPLPPNDEVPLSVPP